MVGEMIIMLAKRVCQILSAFFIGMLFIEASNILGGGIFGNQEKYAVFIIGPGRCGSSCATGIMQILGLYLGTALIEGDRNNPKGYFENPYFIKLDNEMLEALGTYAFDSTPFMHDLTQPEFDPYKNCYKNEMQQHFGQTNQFGIKNGKITLLLPLYARAAQELGFKIKVIVLMRHPEEIAQSYLIYGNISQEDSFAIKRVALALVEKFYALIEQYSSSYDLLKIEYNDLLFNTEQTVQKMNAFLPFLKRYDETKEEIINFLDVSLKHHNLG